MKASLLLAALTVSLAAAFSAGAQTPTAPAAPAVPAAPKDFATRKADMVGRIDQHMAAMTTMRDCVNAANTPADLKACRKQEHAGRHHHNAPA